MDIISLLYNIIIYVTYVIYYSNIVRVMGRQKSYKHMQEKNRTSPVYWIRIGGISMNRVVQQTQIQKYYWASRLIMIITDYNPLNKMGNHEFILL